jgi:hypothetical protein
LAAPDVLDTVGGTSPARDSAAVQYAIQVAEDDIDARFGDATVKAALVAAYPTKLSFWATRRAMWLLDSKRTARDDSFGKMLDAQQADDAREQSAMVRLYRMNNAGGPTAGVSSQFGLNGFGRVPAVDCRWW